MPKDPKAVKEAKSVRPARTLSKFADAFTGLKVTDVIPIVDESADADEKLEGPSKLAPQPDAIALERETMGASWFEALRDEFEKPYFTKVALFLPCCALPATDLMPIAEKIRCGGAQEVHNIPLQSVLCSDLSDSPNSLGYSGERLLVVASHAA
jgi:hypothetical protein